MDNTTLAHIGGELVLIGGVAFYFHRKTSLLQAEINIQKKTIAELVKAINELQEDMNQMVLVIQQQQPRTVQRSPVRPPATTHRVAPQTQLRRQRENFLQTSANVPGTARKTRVDSDDTGDETLDDRQLDAELAGELEQLENDGVCSEGQCKLID